MKPMYPEIPLAQQILQGCKAKGIRQIVLSPGSRNIPLIIGFSSDSYFTCYSIVDERSAAFFALGLSQQKREPVAVVCTSGSAVLNYYPAVSEAYYANIPLVVISADRPVDKIDIGDGQTIRQAGVLANHTAYNANLTSTDFHQNEKLINFALNTALKEHLPVHLNAPFEEPLFGLTEQKVVFNNIEENPQERELKASEVDAFLEDWNKASKVLVLFGVEKPNEIEDKWLHFFDSQQGVVILTETTSNVAGKINYFPIDAFLTKLEKQGKSEDFRPDLLLSFGGMFISKKIKQFLRKYSPKQHYHIDSLVGYDTYGVLTKHFKSSAREFLSQYAQLMSIKEGTYRSLALSIKEELPQGSFFQELNYSDFWVYSQVFTTLPENIVLQISNSFAVRYAQYFTPKKSWEVYCNRGTSGIDGATSTAVGAAVGSEKPVVFLTGDLSFFYDSNAFWNQYIPQNFKVILINNGGGGIFRAIFPRKTDAYFSPYIEAEHNLSAIHLCQMHQVKYFKADCKKTLTRELEQLLQTSEAALLEVFTSKEENDKAYATYFI